MPGPASPAVDESESPSLPPQDAPISSTAADTPNPSATRRPTLPSEPAAAEPSPPLPSATDQSRSARYGHVTLSPVPPPPAPSSTRVPGDACSSMAPRRSSYPSPSPSDIAGRLFPEQPAGAGPDDSLGTTAARGKGPALANTDAPVGSSRSAASQQQLHEYREKLARDLELREMSAREFPRRRRTSHACRPYWRRRRPILLCIWPCRPMRRLSPETRSEAA
ncbi:hypothetical protein ACCO45_005321 [Purpureocillium lilacinum]|uniref:Uncharacterized protein n=1 Tax=Purpureocillium lilacinum TaxID=33203 RepID=A0ACC4DWE5_PURLI